MNKNIDLQISTLLFDQGTESKAVLKQIKLILDMVEAFVTVIDAAGNTLFINQNGKELLGQMDIEVTGKHFTEHFIAKEDRRKINNLFKTIFEENAKEAAYHEVHLCRSDLETRILKIKLNPIADIHDDITGIVISGSDITDQKQSHRKLFRSKEKAEHLNKAKSEFLAKVSHEIRTPLNAIMGFSEQLMQTRLDSQQSEYLNIIDKSSEHLLSLINDILVIQKIEAKALSFEKAPFKIAYPVKYIYNTLCAKAEEKNIKFTYHIDEKLKKLVLIGDAFRLRQILINILSNAIKFTHQGYVELKCFTRSETADAVDVGFDIIDTGIGISPNNIDKIFGEFQQADSTITKSYGGTGLGLTICKRLIEMQNGSLSVASQEGNGTTFTFSIPFEKGMETAIVPPDFGAIDSNKLREKNVLLADDDSVNRLLGKILLDKFNCICDIANSGEEAIEKLKRMKYDIVLLDIHMPDVNGLEVARFLRRTKDNNSTKIIAVTAAFMQHEIKTFYESGIDDFLIKPFKEVNLFNKMCNVLDIKTAPEKPSKTKIILKEYNPVMPYNLAELEKMAVGDADFVNRMLITFIDNTESTIHLLPQLLKEKDWEQIGETAHKILPSYRHLEVDDIVSILIDLKTKTLIKPDYKEVPALVKSTTEEMKKLVLELKKEIGK